MDIDDWKCVEPHPNSGFEFRHLANNEYEAVVVRNRIEDEEQPVFKLFPNLREWPAKDVFTPDPVNPRSWIDRSRTDDLLVFSDGTTFNPLEFEQQISGHPEIKAALMFGTRRPQAALLIELETPQGLSGDARSDTVERLSKGNVHGSVSHSEVTPHFHAGRKSFAEGRQRNGATSTSFPDV